MAQLIECVPNFSEGRDMAVMKQITDAIESVEGVTLLDVDPGAATNRTVVTFVGEPAPVIEAAVRAGRKAAELIDMSRHHGEHPRFGAMDVCPLVPVANITMDETAEFARQLARRLGEEVGLTIYCYESAATKPERRNLATVRAGEYEGLADKLKKTEWKPDFGPDRFNARSGATAVGARDFLVAYNVNLNSTSTRRANAIAFDIREKGRVRREGDPLTGRIVTDANGEPVWEPGSLKCVKGIGWFIEEYGVAQISMNLTNISVTPVHVAFDECCAKAQERGIRVTGSEVVGLLPLKSMLEAGEYFLRKQQRSLGVSDKELIKIAVKSMGMDELAPFNPEEKIIEYAIAAKAGNRKRLVDMTLTDFTHETASESPAPGGGSIAAACGAFGAALGTMVANLSSHKRGWDDRWEEFSEWAVRGKKHHDELLRLIDEDTAAFNRIMDAFGLPKGTEEEAAARTNAIQEATKGAIETPLRVMRVALESMDVARKMAEIGMSASASDAGVAALCARTAVKGAYLNVQINAKDLKDAAARDDFLSRGGQIEEKAEALERDILAIVQKAMTVKS
ncbi:MAG TPA: glutamate formimidoyltransferase [Phycisphaerae bacterium]|nr:glutamate formimidoyltransferase [Phycisphaerae bacterium]HRW55047.1 glutamate formimidoyltransferase [Phycisphaerae bacterium]